jgi:multisubunit Na+/H+ antiporter MnhE subunit
MMRSNPLVAEVLVGLTRQGKAQLDCLGMLLAQAAVVFLWWPKSEVAQMLESQHGPQTLTALVIAMGITTAYVALRAGAEEILLPGQHGLRKWALETPLGLGRILRGYVLGQLVHGLHMLALSSPLLLMAFTVSGGEWVALGWCMTATFVQALFYRLCGAITHLTIGQHRTRSRYTVRAILVLVYVAVGLLAPFTSHVEFTLRALGESVTTQPAFAAVPDHVAFLATYTGLSVLAALVLHRLLLHSRRGRADPQDGAGFVEALPS